jgi:hypothetical protein
MIHGNLEIALANQIVDREWSIRAAPKKPFKDRRVIVNASIDRNRVEFTVRVRPEFDIRQVSDRRPPRLKTPRAGWY